MYIYIKLLYLIFSQHILCSRHEIDGIFLHRQNKILIIYSNRIYTRDKTRRLEVVVPLLPVPWSISRSLRLLLLRRHALDDEERGTSMIQRLWAIQRLTPFPQPSFVFLYCASAPCKISGLLTLAMRLWKISRRDFTPATFDCFSHENYRLLL